MLRNSSSRPFAVKAQAHNIVPFRQKILPRHKDYLSQWLEAGLTMGLLDALIDPLSPKADHILIWVRENTEPAYAVSPLGGKWVLTDRLNEYELGRFSSLDKALNKIRPVLPLHH
ncbi:hypothetical protein GT348_04605 [Aristophania vespae]|uniref:Uncharacterized protein n=1 Tax=Aristophania vespae TaxID=2697033 RepID=A0A6P1NDK2_9PROT|nr:hypothetical protein GT348_04605 [Aristophania vespae]